MAEQNIPALLERAARAVEIAMTDRDKGILELVRQGMLSWRDAPMDDPQRKSDVAALRVLIAQWSVLLECAEEIQDCAIAGIGVDHHVECRFCDSWVGSGNLARHSDDCLTRRAAEALAALGIAVSKEEEHER